MPRYEHDGGPANSTGPLVYWDDVKSHILKPTSGLSLEETNTLIARLGKEGIEDLLSECNLRITAVEQMLVDAYETEGVTSLKLEEGGSLAVQVEPYAQVQDRDVYRRWCVEQGLENLMTVPWATTSKLTKDRLLNGEPEPPGVKAYAKMKIVLRK